MNSWHQFDFMGGGVEAAKHTPIMEAVCLSLIFYAKKIKIYPFFGHKKGEKRAGNQFCSTTLQLVHWKKYSVTLLLLVRAWTLSHNTQYNWPALYGVNKVASRVVNPTGGENGQLNFELKGCCEKTLHIDMDRTH